LKCSCPGTNGNNFATSCSLNRSTGKETCDCLVGYTGDSCEKCQEHYYGSPLKLGGSCQFCQCNGNVDSNNRNTCDSKTGQCLGCLFNTEGFNCERCKPGFYGNALEHKCKRKIEFFRNNLSQLEKIIYSFNKHVIVTDMAQLTTPRLNAMQKRGTVFACQM